MEGGLYTDWKVSREECYQSEDITCKSGFFSCLKKEKKSVTCRLYVLLYNNSKYI